MNPAYQREISNVQVSEDSDKPKAVTPANAGVQSRHGMISLDSRSPIGVEDKVRGNDKNR